VGRATDAESRNEAVFAGLPPSLASRPMQGE